MAKKRLHGHGSSVSHADKAFSHPRRYDRLDALPSERACRRCGQVKPLTDGFFYRHSKGGFRHECMECRRVQTVLDAYGLTGSRYLHLEEQQGGVCAICLQKNFDGRSLVVDHCHKTLRIRGLLCGTCNLAIGYMRDDPGILRQAAEYLECAPGSADTPTAG